MESLTFYICLFFLIFLIVSDRRERLGWSDLPPDTVIRSNTNSYKVQPGISLLIPTRPYLVKHKLKNDGFNLLLTELRIVTIH